MAKGKSKAQREAEAEVLATCRKLVLAYRYRPTAVYDTKLLFAVSHVVEATERMDAHGATNRAGSLPGDTDRSVS